MNYRSLFSSVRYRGLVRSAKRNYHVAEAVSYYVLLSPGKGDSGNFTVVPRKAVDYLAKRLGGKRSVTSADALAACRRSKFLRNRFAVLNVLYVLVGTKRARIAAMKGQTLYFDILRRPR